MAEPKKRTNNTKQGMRRMHDKAKSGAIVYCEKCHEPKLNHTVCYNCGSYNNSNVIEQKSEKKESEVK